MTDQAAEILRHAKERAGITEPIQLAVLMDDQVPPVGAAVLSLGAYERRGQERVVKTYSIPQVMSKADSLTVLGQAFKLLAGKVELPEFKYKVVNALLLNKLVHEWEGIRLMADIETRGDADAQVPSWDEVISLAFYDGETAYVIPEDMLGNELVRNCVGLILSRNNVSWHNGKFDCKYVGSYPFSDSMLMHYALYPAASAHGAKELAKTYFGAEDWDSEVKKKYLKGKTYNAYTDLSETNGPGAYAQAMTYTAKNGYERIPRPELYKYNAYDVYWQWYIEREVERVLETDPEAQKLYKRLMDLSHMFQRVETPGNRFNVEYMADLSEQLTEEGIELKSRFQKMCGWEVNPNSHVQVKKAFHEQGVMVPSTGKEIMIPLMEAGNEMAEALMAVRDNTKENGTYVTGYLKKLIDGRGYGTLKLHAASTGRLGGGGAALLTIPRKKRVKKMVLPDEGHVMVSADLSQAELRVMAVESGDPWMIAAFQPDAGDIFDILLSAAKPEYDWHELHRQEKLGNDPGQFYQTWRAYMKGVVYGVSFGRGIPAIAYALKTTKDVAQLLVDGFVRPGSEFSQWREEISRKAVANEPIVNPYGRQFQAELITRKNKQNVIRAALSFPSQSTANDICLEAALQVVPQMEQFDARFMTTLHDAHYVSTPKEHAEEVGRILTSELEKAGLDLYGGIVPFKSSMAIGENMAEV